MAMSLNKPKSRNRINRIRQNNKHQCWISNRVISQLTRSLLVLVQLYSLRIKDQPRKFRQKEQERLAQVLWGLATPLVQANLGRCFHRAMLFDSVFKSHEQDRSERNVWEMICRGPRVRASFQEFQTTWADIRSCQASTSRIRKMKALWASELVHPTTTKKMKKSINLKVSKMKKVQNPLLAISLNIRSIQSTQSIRGTQSILSSQTTRIVGKKNNRTGKNIIIMVYLNIATNNF